VHDAGNPVLASLERELTIANQQLVGVAYKLDLVLARAEVSCTDGADWPA
jgi:hypothetical protein